MASKIGKKRKRAEGSDLSCSDSDGEVQEENDTQSEPDSDLEDDDLDVIAYGDDRLRDIFLEDSDDTDEFYGFFPDIDGNITFTWDQVDKQVTRIDFADQVPNAGPKHQLDKDTASELDYFQLFVPDEILVKLLTWTDQNAKDKIAKEPNKNKSQWYCPTLEEFRAFLAVKLCLNEQIKLPHEERIFMQDKRYWLFHVSGISKLFTMKRYRQISRYLKFCHPEEENPRNKLTKVKPWLDHLAAAFKRNFYPFKALSIDEGMIPFKGRLGMKQRIASKPIKWGIKVFMLTDSRTGYLYKFEIYTGKSEVYDEAVGQAVGKTGAVVVSLLTGLEAKGHELYTDRFYTSPTLFCNLFRRGIYACGTAVTNWKMFPKSIIPANKRRLNRGDYDWCVSEEGILATMWLDKEPIYMLSGVHDSPPQIIQTERWQKGQDGMEKLPLQSLNVVQDYNKNMGGCDLNDQMTKLNKSKKEYRWYRRVGYKGLEWSMYNAFLLFKHDHPDGPGSRKYGLLKFRDNVVMQLVGNYRRTVMRGGNVRRQEAEDRLQSGNHFPAVGDSSNHTCAVCRKKHNMYKQKHNVGRKLSENPHKLSKSSFYCTLCNEYLCVKKSSTCWADYHTKVQYWR